MVFFCSRDPNPAYADLRVGGGDGVSGGGFAGDRYIFETELGNFCVEACKRQATVEQGAQYHIAANTRKTVKVGNFHLIYQGRRLRSALRLAQSNSTAKS